MKHIDEIYKDWCGEHHTINSCHPVHDSSEVCDFAEYYHKVRLEEMNKIPTQKFSEDLRNKYTKRQITEMLIEANKLLEAKLETTKSTEMNSIAQFNKIVKNYKTMKRIESNYADMDTYNLKK